MHHDLPWFAGCFPIGGWSQAPGSLYPSFPLACYPWLSLTWFKNRAFAGSPWFNPHCSPTPRQCATKLRVLTSGLQVWAAVWRLTHFLQFPLKYCPKVILSLGRVKVSSDALPIPAPPLPCLKPPTGGWQDLSCSGDGRCYHSILSTAARRCDWESSVQSSISRDFYCLICWVRPPNHFASMHIHALYNYILIWLYCFTHRVYILVYTVQWVAWIHGRNPNVVSWTHESNQGRGFRFGSMITQRFRRVSIQGPNSNCNMGMERLVRHSLCLEGC